MTLCKEASNTTSVLAARYSRVGPTGATGVNPTPVATTQHLFLYTGQPWFFASTPIYVSYVGELWILQPSLPEGACSGGFTIGVCLPVGVEGKPTDLDQVRDSAEAAGPRLPG